MLKRLPMIASLGALASCLMTLAQAPAQAREVKTGSCVGTWGAMSCVKTWREGVSNPHIISVGPRTHDDKVDSAERERLWVAYCQPALRQDRYGVSRYSYAKPGCEFGRYQ